VELETRADTPRTALPRIRNQQVAGSNPANGSSDSIGCLRQSFEVALVSRYERKLTRHGHRRDEDVADLLAMTARHCRPDLGCQSRSFLVKRKHEAVGDERLESLPDNIRAGARTRFRQ
jgi:hypothetical protein